MNNILKVIEMLETFRQSEQGCAWTQQQTYQTLAPQTIEEAYELAEAAEEKNLAHLKSELGDILYHFLFYTMIAEENEHFTLDDICNDILEKHQRRMPNTIERQDLTPEEINEHWQALKAKEREKYDSILDNVPKNLPALTYADKIQKRAAEVGFDWENAEQVFEKIHEEIEEVREEIQANDIEKIQDEIGDLLFSITNLARHLNINPETALRQSNRKFEKRFRKLEILTKERSIDLTQMDMMTSLELWEEVKKSG